MLIRDDILWLTETIKSKNEVNGDFNSGFTYELNSYHVNGSFGKNIAWTFFEKFT